jgi:hypothetical protein
MRCFATCTATFKREKKMNITRLSQFTSRHQFAQLFNAYVRDDYEALEKIAAILVTINTMPVTMEQEHLEGEAIVYLHYEWGNGNWYITEKDINGTSSRAFGYADFGDDSAELGYISIKEITQIGAELDLAWKPKTLNEVMGVMCHE